MRLPGFLLTKNMAPPLDVFLVILLHLTILPWPLNSVVSVFHGWSVPVIHFQGNTLKSFWHGNRWAFRCTCWQFGCTRGRNDSSFLELVFGCVKISRVTRSVRRPTASGGLPIIFLSFFFYCKVDYFITLKKKIWMGFEKKKKSIPLIDSWSYLCADADDDWTC